MKAMGFKYLIIIFFVSIGKIFGQNITSLNYEIVPCFGQCLQRINYETGLIETDCCAENYMERWMLPFSPQSSDFFLRLGISDSSNLKINIHSEDQSEKIIDIDTNISKGCYYLDWISKNLDRLSGRYICSCEITGFKSEATSFQKKIEIVIPKSK